MCDCLWMGRDVRVGSMCVYVLAVPGCVCTRLSMHKGRCVHTEVCACVVDHCVSLVSL